MLNMQEFWSISINPHLPSLSFLLSIYLTSKGDVRNMASFIVQVQDINSWCPEYSQSKLLIFGISLIISVHIPHITAYILDITVHVLNIIVHIPDIAVLIPDITFFLLSMFQIWKLDIRNMNSFLCPYSRHQLLKNGIWIVSTVNTPDIDVWSHGLLKDTAGFVASYRPITVGQFSKLAKQ